MCLRALPIGKATEGHFPSRQLKTWKRRTELMCADCNSFHGSAYEPAGLRLLGASTRVRLSTPGTGAIDATGTVRSEGKTLSIELDGWNKKQEAAFAEIQARSADPGGVDISVQRTVPPSAGKALFELELPVLVLVRWLFVYRVAPGRQSSDVGSSPASQNQLLASTVTLMTQVQTTLCRMPSSNHSRPWIRPRRLQSR